MDGNTSIKNLTVNYLSSKISSFAILLSLSACTLFSTSEKEVMEYKGPYFHSRDFFEAEIARVEAAAYTFRKQVHLNEDHEEKILDSLDMTKELSVFLKNDLNRPAYDGRYQVDSTFDAQQQLLAINYKALDDKLTVRNLKLEYENSNLNRIELQTNAESRLLKANSTAIYEPKKGYRVDNYQKITFVGEQHMQVAVDYVVD